MAGTEISPIAQPTWRRFFPRWLLMSVVTLFALVLGSAFRSFLDQVSPPDRRDWAHGNIEESRMTSPDGTMDAVVDCYCATPAMVSPWYYLHIVRRGKTLAEDSSPALLVSRREISALWVDNAHLRAVPERGMIESFSNLWSAPDGRERLVEVVLAQKLDEPLLTPEGNFAPSK